MEIIRQIIKRTGIFKAFDRNISRMVEIQLIKQRLDLMANSLEAMGVEQTTDDETELVVSLTTHGKRIMTVYRTIESVFAQSKKANRIVLYVSVNEYQSVEQLPLILQKQMKRGLEVRFVEDIGPYTKIIHALKEFPNSNIVTVDDDIWYPLNTLEKLHQVNREHPDAICAIAARELDWKDKHKKKFKTYEKQPFAVNEKQNTTSKMYVAEGVGGVLYPPSCFTDEVFRKEIFMVLAPKADDLWLKAMSLISGTPVYVARNFYCPTNDIIYDDDVQDIGLYHFNFAGKGNDKQWKALCDHYNLYEKLM